MSVNRFDKPQRIPTSLDWNATADFLLRSCTALEERLPGFRATAFVQEMTGVSINMDKRREAIVPGAPRPAGFSGASTVLTLSNGSRKVEWASPGCGEVDVERGFRILEEKCKLLAATNVESKPLGTVEWLDFINDSAGWPNSVPLEDKVKAIRSLRERTERQIPSSPFCMARYLERQTTEMFVSTSRVMRQQLAKMDLVVVAIAPTPGGRQTMVFRGACGCGDFHSLKIGDEEFAEMAREVKALENLEPVTPGEFDLIVDEELGGMIAHEAFGHGAEADVVTQGRSRCVAYLGNQVASPLLNMVDSPCFPGGPSNFFFDHEGTLAQDVHIIRNGILENVMSHSTPARILGVPQTANGRRQSLLNRVYTRMTNTCFLPGTSTLDEMISSIDHGYYAVAATAGMEDPKGWGMQIVCSFAWEIRNGRRTGRVVGPVCLTGYVPDVLKSITMVGNRMLINGRGLCGKGHKEFVETGCGSPALKLRARIS